MRINEIEDIYYSSLTELLSPKLLTSLKMYEKGIVKETKHFSVLNISKHLDYSHDQLDYFISRAHWSERCLNSIRFQKDIQSSQSNKLDLVIDDSSMLKHTRRPYFIAPGWIGNLGKVDKCLSNVFANLIGSDVNIPFDFETYLPSGKLVGGQADWEFQSKLDLMISLVTRVFLAAKENGFQIGYALFDLWFAAGWVLNKLHDGAVKYFTEIRPNRRVQVEDKTWRKAGDIVTVLSSSPVIINHKNKPFEVTTLIGRLKSVSHPVKIFIVRGKFRTKPETRIFITNDLNLSETELFQMIAKRWQIEYFFRESKSYLALDQGKFQKLICYRRHFYLCMLSWSISRQYIKQRISNVKTVCGYIRLKNSVAA
jgi:hypothetical protein